MNDFDITAPGGRVHVHAWGPDTGIPVIGIPGLSQNGLGFSAIAAPLAAAGRRFLAFDPRGRGLSETTAPGTYGWPSHARDILALADHVGAPQFDLVGLSMGAWIAMETARLAPGRVRRMVLVDALGIPDENAAAPVYAGLERLETVYPSYEAFGEAAQASGLLTPWEGYYDEYFRFELQAVEGGVRARTARHSAREDDDYRLANFSYDLWKAVDMPVLVVRAEREIVPGFGYILTETDTTRFLAEVPSSELVTVDAGHYTIAGHPDTAAAIARFLT